MLPALVRRWLNRPKRSDTRLLAQFFYADQDVARVVSELHCLEMQKDPQHYLSLLNQLHVTQERLLTLIAQISEQCVPQQLHRREYQMKFPEEVLNDNISTHVLFAAELLVSGTYIEVDEDDGIMLSPLARDVLYSLEDLRNLLREQSLTDPGTFTEPIHKALIQFDALFAEFELRYVSLVVSVKTPEEIFKQQEIVVLFCETIARALKLGYLTQDMIDVCEPQLMFTIPRLSIISGLLIYPDGPLNLQRRREDMSKLFSPFYGLLTKIRDLLYVLSEEELVSLEKSLCSADSDDSQPDLTGLDTQTEVTSLDEAPSDLTDLGGPQSDLSGIHLQPASIFQDLQHDRTVLAVSPGHRRSSSPSLSPVSSCKLRELAQVDGSAQLLDIGTPPHTPRNFVGAIKPNEVQVGQGIVLDPWEWDSGGPQEMTCSLHFQKHVDQRTIYTTSCSPGQCYSDWVLQAALPHQAAAPQEVISPELYRSQQESVTIIHNDGCQDAVCPLHHMTPNTCMLTLLHNPLLSWCYPLQHRPTQSMDLSQSLGTPQACTSKEQHKALEAEESSSFPGVPWDSGLFLHLGVPQYSASLMRHAVPHKSTYSMHHGVPCVPASSMHHEGSPDSASSMHHTSPMPHEGSPDSASSMHHTSQVHHEIPPVYNSPVYHESPQISALHNGIPQVFASPSLHEGHQQSASQMHYEGPWDSASPMHQGVSPFFASPIHSEVPRDSTFTASQVPASQMYFVVCRNSASTMHSGLHPVSASVMQHGVTKDSASTMHHGVPQVVSSLMYSGVPQDPASTMHHGMLQDAASTGHHEVPRVFVSPMHHEGPQMVTSSVLYGFPQGDAFPLQQWNLENSRLLLHHGAPNVDVPEEAASPTCHDPAQEAPSTHSVGAFLGAGVPRNHETRVWIPDSCMADNLANLERSMLSGSSQGPGTNHADSGSSTILRHAMARAVMRGTVSVGTPQEHCQRMVPQPPQPSRHQGQNSRETDEHRRRGSSEARQSMRTEIRSRYRSTSDMLHRLFVCIAGVADQLQTNFASDLRPILKTVFEISASKPETSEISDAAQDEESRTTGSERSPCEYLEDCALCLEVTLPNTEDQESGPPTNEPPEWVPDSASSSCMDCQAPFTLVRRRHHCRSCGKIFCSRCSPHMVPLPRFGHIKAVRVCNHCFTTHTTSRSGEVL